MTAVASAQIAANLARVRERIESACARSGRDPASVTLVGVSKTVEPPLIAEAVRAGLADLGENRVQEALPKGEAIAVEGLSPTWHLVGHLQTNKAKQALELFTVIHSIDSTRLVEALAKRTIGPVECFIEVNISGEASKHGASADDVPEILHAIDAAHALQSVGLMTVAPQDASETELRRVFSGLRELAERYSLPKLSMGMTGDFELAIEEGATHVRVGRAIFGERA